MTQNVHYGLANQELQEELRDLLALALAGDHMRWVVVGGEASELAEWLADAVPQWRALADRVARHLVTLDVAPDARVRSLAKDIPLHWVPEGWLGADEAGRLVLYRLRGLGESACFRRSQATDPNTAQLLEDVCSTLKAYAQAAEVMLADIQEPGTNVDPARTSLRVR